MRLLDSQQRQFVSSGRCFKINVSGNWAWPGPGEKSYRVVMRERVTYFRDVTAGPWDDHQIAPPFTREEWELIDEGQADSQGKGMQLALSWLPEGSYEVFL